MSFIYQNALCLSLRSNKSAEYTNLVIQTINIIKKHPLKCRGMCIKLEERSFHIS